MRRLLSCLFVLALLSFACAGAETVAEGYDLLPSIGMEDAYTLAENQGVTLRISCDEATVFPGETVTLMVTVDNHAQQMLEKLSLSEISIGSGTWGSYAATLPPGDTLRVAYTLRVPDALHDRAVFCLQWEGDMLTAQHEMNVAEPVQLTVSAEVKDWPWAAGEEHTADFTVTNNGDALLENVTLTLPGVYLNGDKLGEALFLRKDRRKLKTAQQTDSFLLEELAPGDSVVMTAAWIPESLPEGEVTLSMQAAVEADGRMQTRAATVVMERVVVRPTMWTTMLRGSVSVGHALAVLTALTLLTALAAALRARKLR